MPRERTIKATAAHDALLHGYKDAVLEHASDMPELEILCVTAQFLGQLLATQDASKPAAIYLEMISRNLEVGNAEAIGAMMGHAGGKQ